MCGSIFGLSELVDVALLTFCTAHSYCSANIEEYTITYSIWFILQLKHSSRLVTVPTAWQRKTDDSEAAVCES